MEKTIRGGALCSLLLTEFYLGGQIKKTEMGRAGSMKHCSLSEQLSEILS